MSSHAAVSKIIVGGLRAAVVVSCVVWVGWGGAQDPAPRSTSVSDRLVTAAPPGPQLTPPAAPAASQLVPTPTSLRTCARPRVGRTAATGSAPVPMLQSARSTPTPAELVVATGAAPAAGPPPSSLSLPGLPPITLPPVLPLPPILPSLIPPLPAPLPSLLGPPASLPPAPGGVAPPIPGPPTGPAGPPTAAGGPPATVPPGVAGPAAPAAGRVSPSLPVGGLGDCPPAAAIDPPVLAGGLAPSESALQARAVAVADSYLGTPYVWGGASPGGFDCSGLVQWSFARAGLDLPRVAQDQYDSGPLVGSAEPVVPGDLVFFGSSPEGVEHVGIYLGNGEMIDAPHTGSFVRVDPVRGFGDLVGVTSPGGLQAS